MKREKEERIKDKTYDSSICVKGGSGVIDRCSQKQQKKNGRSRCDWDGTLPSDTGNSPVIAWSVDGSTMVFKSMGEACEFFEIRRRDTLRVYIEQGQLLPDGKTFVDYLYTG